MKSIIIITDRIPVEFTDQTTGTVRTVQLPDLGKFSGSIGYVGGVNFELVTSFGLATVLEVGRRGNKWVFNGVASPALIAALKNELGPSVIKDVNDTAGDAQLRRFFKDSGQSAIARKSDGKEIGVMPVVMYQGNELKVALPDGVRVDDVEIAPQGAQMRGRGNV